MTIRINTPNGYVSVSPGTTVYRDTNSTVVVHSGDADVPDPVPPSTRTRKKTKRKKSAYGRFQDVHAKPKRASNAVQPPKRGPRTKKRRQHQPQEQHQETQPLQRAPVKRALLIGVTHLKRQNPPEPELLWQASRHYHGACAVAKQLREHFSYLDSEITLLTDIPNNDSDMPNNDSDYDDPTRKRILDTIDALLADAVPGDRFFFGFFGHGHWKRDRQGKKVAGLRAADGRIIWQAALRKHLIFGLAPGATLTVFTTSCYSEGILGMRNVYSGKGVVRGKAPRKKRRGDRRDNADADTAPVLRREVIHLSGARLHQLGLGFWERDLSRYTGRPSTGGCISLTIRSFVRALAERGGRPTWAQLVADMGRLNRQMLAEHKDSDGSESTQSARAPTPRVTTRRPFDMNQLVDM